MSYTLQNAIDDTRRHLKDTTQNIWTNTDIISFINDAMRIVKRSLPLYFSSLSAVDETSDVIYIDDDYTYILSLFAAARCFEQDEQHYRAVQKMNEFESRKTDMVNEIMDSDEYAAILEALDNQTDAVVDVYFDEDTTTMTPVGLL